MTQLVLFIICCVTFASIYSYSRYVSAVLFAALGLLAYSIPALLGVSATAGVGQQSSYIYQTSTLSIRATILVWLGFLAVISLSPRQEPPSTKISTKTLETFALCALALSLILLAPVVYQNGVIFVVRPRQEISTGPIYLIWKWCCAFGLLSAILAHRIWLACLFCVLLALIAVAGDRTTPLICMASVCLATCGGMPIKSLLCSFRAWCMAGGLLAIVFFTKPIYRIVKATSLHNLTNLTLREFILQWEAFGIHEILVQVIEKDFPYSWTIAAKDAFAQLLIVPSAFGFQSNHFNIVMQKALFPEVSYGLAYNCWAQWYAMSGWAGLCVGGALFANVDTCLRSLYKPKQKCPHASGYTTCDISRGILPP